MALLSLSLYLSLLLSLSSLLSHTAAKMVCKLFLRPVMFCCEVVCVEVEVILFPVNYAAWMILDEVEIEKALLRERESP